MNKYIISPENLESLNEWTATLYTLLHSLKICKDNDFEPRDKLNESGIDSFTWETKRNDFNSITHRITSRSKKKMKLRRDPSINFKNCRNVNPRFSSYF